MFRRRLFSFSGIALVLALILLSLTLPQAAQAATFEVNTAADTDDGTCNAADCSLREAINDANNNPNGGAPDRIEFRIGASGSPAQIVLGSALPIITDPLVIDGFTQGGTSCINVDGTVLTVEVNGGPGGFNGFVIDTDDTTINGLVINGFTGTGVAGVRIQGDNNSLTCSFFGTNTTGTAAVANGSGVIIDGGANNQIGTNGQANLISGNTDYGVHLTGAAATNNLVQFNTIGLNRTGTAALANGNSGVFIDGAPNNGILNNLITSNPTGIFISGVGAASNRLFGNIIGLDVTGSTVIAGGTTGISVNNAPDNRIGGTNPSEINTVSGQAADGILITGAGATGNRVENNYVGTDISALNDLGNGDNGIEVLSASGNTIGGNVPEAGNLVGGNQQFGILLDATANNNTVANNRIGINVNFNGTIPNNVGIVVRFSSNNLIGGPNQGNTVGGNLGSGITLTEASSTGNTVQGNYVGLTSFNDVFGNGSYGIRVNTAANNLIGGTGVGEGNTVANNTRDGVIIAGAAAGNRILGNLISNNGGLGIDLDTDDTDAGNADVTANDPGDADGGANAQQNFPVITAARGTNVDIYLAGTLDSTANTTYRLEFYSNPTCDASGNGESAVFIASTTVTTDGAGAATFAEIFPLGAPINTGDSITATATDQTTNNTSELSPCVVITDAPKYEADTPPGTVSVSTTVGFPTDITVRADNRDGRAPLDISSVTIDNTTDFTLITPITPPTVTIAAGDPVSNFANITVRCLAANLGTFQTTLTILTNDPTQPAGGFIYTLICQVNPVNPTPVYLSVPAAGQTIDFGGVLVNTPGTQQLRIENTGTADLTVNLAITSGGANFAIQPPTALTITASNFTLVNLTCTPTALGPITGTLQALTNDTNQPVGGFTYPLTCEGLVPGYASTPAPGATINLTTTVGTPVTTTVTVSETGNAPLDVSDVSLSNTTGFTRTTPASFTINNGGAAQDIIVQCDATSPGNFTTDLNVETNDPAQPGGGFSYTINCLVNAAGYNSTPLPGTAINLTTTVGTPTDATIAVQETGNLPLTVNVALSNTTDFTLTSPATFTINDGGAAQNIVVRCNATTDTGSPFTTTVTVTTNDPTQPVGGYTYTVNCTVTPVTGTPGYGSTPPSGTVIPLTTTVGTPIDATIAVNETGTAPLTVNVALSNTTDFTLTSPTTFNIADGGAAQNIVVRCNATTDTGSPFTTTVTVTTNDPSQPTVTYTVNCTVNRPVYRSAPTPGGTIPLTTTQGTPVNAIISVNEGGNAALIVDNVVLSNTTNFTLLSPTTFTINDGGAAQDIIVQCNATTSIGSPFTTNVTGTHNAAGSPAIYTVVCTVNPVTGTPGYGSTPPSGTAIPLTTTVGTPIDTTIAVNETGTAPLTVNVALSNTTDFTLNSPATFTINDGGAAQNIVVRCNATTDIGSPFTTTVTVTTNDPTQPAGGYTYSITCTVTPVTGTPGYGSTPSSGTVIPLTTTVGTPIDATIVVTETGNAPLTVNVALSNTTDFTLTSPATFNIADGGAAQNIIVRCNATTDTGSPFTTTVTVTTNDPTQPAGGYTYPITCTVNPITGTPGYGSTPPSGTAIPLTTTVGTPIDTTIAVNETGTAPLTVNVALSNTTDFTLTSPATFNIADGGAAQNIVVRCNATTETGSPFTTTVTVTTNDPTQPAGGYTYPITCTVTPVTGTPGYGSNPTNGTAIPLTTTVGTPINATIAVTETGNAPLTVNVALSNTTDFTLTSPATFTINDGGAAQNIVVRCNATTNTGSPFTTTVTVTTNDPTQPAGGYTYPITCTVNPGAGTSGYASTPNPSATIPLVTVVATPVNAVINVTETGTAPLTVNVALSNAANFTLVSPTSFTIADGGAAQDIIVRCNAVQAGSYTTTITATTNDPAQPAAGFQYTVTCRVGQNSGRFYDSVPPPNTVLPTVNTTINVNGTTTVTIFNAGTEALTISAITWTNNPVFTVTPAAPFTLTAPNSSQILTITCRSATPGTFQSVVSVTHDGQNPAPEAPTVTYTVNCNVSSLGTPGYSSAPAPGSTINFGSALVGTTITTSLVVSETGGATLQVTQPAQPITGTNAADFAIISGGPPFSIPDGGQNRIITLRCIPLALGTRTALLTFTTNDPARTSVSYTLVCNGVNVLPTPTPVVTTQPPISVVVTQVAAGPTPVTGVVVQVRGLSGRSGPYLGASLLRVARPNNTYPILGRSSDESSQYTWYLIQIGTRQVWVSGRYFQVSGDPFSLPEIRTVFDEIDDVPDTGVAVITRAFADLRRRPSPRSQILQELPPGTQMALLGRTTQNGGNWWYHVRLGEVEGWIPAYAIVRGGNVNDVPLR